MVHTILSGNEFKIFDKRDLNLGPADPKIRKDLLLKQTIHLVKDEVSVRKCFAIYWEKTIFNTVTLTLDTHLKFSRGLLLQVNSHPVKCKKNPMVYKISSGKLIWLFDKFEVSVTINVYVNKRKRSVTEDGLTDGRTWLYQ